MLRDRNRRPAENVIPANAPGVRDLVLALIDIWPSFEWERLVLDPPPGYLDNSTVEKCNRAQTDEMREAKRPVTSWEQTIVSVPDMMMNSYPFVKLKPPPPSASPEEPEVPPSPVPVRPWIKPLSFVQLLRPEEEGGTSLSAEVIAAAPATATGATA